MREELQALKEQALKELETAASVDALKDLRVKYLGKKGHMTDILRGMGSRARRIVERYGQTPKAPEKRLAEKDQKRKVYYKNYTGRVWGQAQNYDICLNSGALGVDTCADMIVQLCK